MTRLFALLLTSAQVLSTVLATTGPIQKRDSGIDVSGKRHVPWLDYEGIAHAAEQSLYDDLRRRGLPTDDVNWKYLGKRQASTCATVEKRIEWRQFTDDQKVAYLTASKCMYSVASLGISPAATTIIDDLSTLHSTNWIEFHGCAAFLPWHRWFVWLHAQGMKSECGYNGPIPYWNYTMDYQNPFGSPIFSNDNKGFGSHGTTVANELGVSGYKIDGGPFAGLQVNIPATHYIARNFSGWKLYDPNGQYGTALGSFFSPSAIATAMASSDFWALEQNVDGLKNAQALGIHNGPHFFNNGDWSGPGWLQGTQWYPSITTASNDPMFWPHHAYVDHVFWSWQQQPGKQNIYNGNKSNGQAAQPSDMLPLYKFGPDVPVSTALTTENYPLCYTY